MHTFICYSSHTKPIRKKLCTRGGGVQEADPIHITYCTANWKNVTEATIDYVQHRGNGAEKLIL